MLFKSPLHPEPPAGIGVAELDVSDARGVEEELVAERDVIVLGAPDELDEERVLHDGGDDGGAGSGAGVDDEAGAGGLGGESGAGRDRGAEEAGRLGKLRGGGGGNGRERARDEGGGEELSALKSTAPPHVFPFEVRQNDAASGGLRLGGQVPGRDDAESFGDGRVGERRGRRRRRRGGGEEGRRVRRNDQEPNAERRNAVFQGGLSRSLTERQRGQRAFDGRGGGRFHEGEGRREGSEVQ